MLHGGSPEQAQMMHPGQQGHVPPGYAMYNPGMMYVGPQASSCHPPVPASTVFDTSATLKRFYTPC